VAHLWRTFSKKSRNAAPLAALLGF